MAYFFVFDFIPCSDGSHGCFVVSVWVCLRCHGVVGGIELRLVNGAQTGQELK